MRQVGLDLRPTEPGFKAHYGRGTGRYATEVSRRLLGGQALAAADSGTQPCRSILPGSEAPLKIVPISIVPITGERLFGEFWERQLVQLTPLGKVTLETQLFLPKRLKRLGLDLVHFFSHGDAPARLQVPYIVTVLDLIPLRFPDLYRADKPGWRFKLARYLELQAIKNASGIIAISECTKRDLVEMLGIDPQRVIVTPLGVDPRFEPRPGVTAGGCDAETVAKAQASRRELLSLPSGRPVLLYVGGIDPRKNIPFLLETFAELLSQYRSPELRPLLMFVGRYETEREYPKFMAQIERLGISGDVHLAGFLNDEQLLQAYHSASVVLFPSLYEGFGLPVLEALACGVPVIAGNNSSIPEVSGEAAVLIKDGDRSAWVSAILTLLESMPEQLARSVAGVNQAAHFSWDQTAQLTYEAYLHFLSNSTIKVSKLPDNRTASDNTRFLRGEVTNGF